MSNREILSTITNFNSRITTVEGSSTDQSADILQLQTDTNSNNGVSQLVRTDGTGTVVSQILPSYIDDVLAFATFASFPMPGQGSKIYVADNEPLKSWRWSGSSYIDVSGGVTSAFGRLGSVVAAPGDYSASQIDFNPAGNIPDTDIQNACQTLDFIKLNETEKGATNGVAPLDGTGLVPAVHLPPLSAPVDSVHGRTGVVNSQLGDYSASQIVNVGLNPAGDVQGALDNIELNKIGSTFTGPVDVNSQDLNNVVNINGVAYESPELRHVTGPFQVGTGGSVTWSWSHGVPGYKFVSVPVWLVNGIHGVTAAAISSFMVTDATFTQTFGTAIVNYTPKGIIAKI